MISIDKWAFHSCTSLAAVVLPEGLTMIKDEAFINCTALTKVTLPSTTAEIGIATFKDGSPALVMTVAEGSYAEEWTGINEYMYQYAP